MGLRDYPRCWDTPCHCGPEDCEYRNRRANKLLESGICFITIAEGEPYFNQLYKLIRKGEKKKGKWTQEDERKYLQLFKKGLL